MTEHGGLPKLLRQVLLLQIQLHSDVLCPWYIVSVKGIKAMTSFVFQQDHWFMFACVNQSLDQIHPYWTDSVCRTGNNTASWPRLLLSFLQIG